MLLLFALEVAFGAYMSASTGDGGGDGGGDGDVSAAAAARAAVFVATSALRISRTRVTYSCVFASMSAAWSMSLKYAPVVMP